MTPSVIHGECVPAMREMPANSVDAIVTDPPYGLEFMGEEWDTFRTGRSASYASGGELSDRADGRYGPVHTKRPARRCLACGRQEWSGSPCNCAEPQWDVDASGMRAFQAWCEDWAREALRVLKPGGHLVAFGAPRLYHRLACGIEDAGFEMRDSLLWLFGQGYPKSHNLDGEWDGWGTTLKPAYEPIVMARKAIASTVAGNMDRHGVGALNIDASRIPFAGASGTWGAPQKTSIGYGGTDVTEYRSEQHPGGRWPANVIVGPHLEDCRLVGTRQIASAQDGGMRSTALGRMNDDAWEPKPTPRRAYGGADGREEVDAWECAPGCPVALLDAESGARGGGYGVRGAGGRLYTGTFQGDGRAVGYGDAGGASRFFYCPKANGAERNAGLSADRANEHKTVKPVDLMRWLCSLVAPPGALILDPFLGSGTTGCAAALEGFQFVGIERAAESVDVARARIAWWERKRGLADAALEVAVTKAEQQRQRDLARADAGQLGFALG